MSTVRLKYVCGHCGSDNVWVSADVEWNTTTQQWEVRRQFDECGCDDCGTENNVDCITEES